MKPSVEVRLSKEAETFCATFLRRMHVAKQPGLKSIVTHAAEVAATTLLAHRVESEALQNIGDGMPIGTPYKFSAGCIEQFRSLYVRMGRDKADFDESVTRSSFISSCVNYCAQNIVGFRSDLYFSLTGSDPNQLWLPLDEISYQSLVLEATKAGAGATKLMALRIVSLFDSIRRLSESEYDAFRKDVLREATSLDRTRFIPHYVEVVGSGIDLDEIERMRGNHGEENRPRFDSLKCALAVRAIRTPDLAGG